MVSEAKLCLLIQPQGSALHLSLNRPLIWDITMTTEMCPSHHPAQTVSAMMKPLGVVLRPAFTEAAYCGLNKARSLFKSILGSDLVILWVTLKSSPSRCHIVSPHADQSSHSITSTALPPTWVRTASLRPLHQQLWREYFLTHTDGVRMQRTDHSET